jgi:nitrogen fixation protein FixH
MKRLTHPGMIILMGFALMLMFMTYLVFQCVRHPSVMVRQNYYDEEMIYQQRIDARNNFAQLRSPVEIENSSEQLVIQFPTDINPNTNTVELEMHHQAVERLDKKVILQPLASGQYIFPLTESMKGPYTLQVSFRMGDKEYLTEKSVIL